MSDAFVERIQASPPTRPSWRLRRAMFGQQRATPECAPTPRLDGAVALVTGGHRGIGLETSAGLSARGAEVISASRSAPRTKDRGPRHFVGLDLADLRSVNAAAEEIVKHLSGRRLSVFVANAGLGPRSHFLSSQGYEGLFASNVLGHHALLRCLHAEGVLEEDARVVIVTGDIYILTSECTSDFDYKGPLGGLRAYCRSKLGDLWMMREWSRRHPELQLHAVHPGVVGSEFQGGMTGFSGWFKRATMLSPARGAQTSLFCATQPGLRTGTYFHNTLGRMELRPDDPAADGVKAARFFDQLEDLVRP